MFDKQAQFNYTVLQKLVSWSLTSLFSTNMAISETSCAPKNDHHIHGGNFVKC